MLGSSAFSLVGQSDFFTWIILFSLFSASILCVAVIALKFIFFKKELKKLKEIVLRSGHVHSLDDFIDIREDFQGTVGGAFVKDGLGELKILLNNVKTSGRLTEQEEHRFDLALNQSSTNAMLNAENYMPVLGVSAAAAPLVGLFGTIWGLINSFVSIGLEKSADLAVVAPGIAMALVTTLAGLVVAIPAMIFFHYFSNQLRRLEYLMGHLSDKFFIIALHTVNQNSVPQLDVATQAAEKTEL